MFTGYRANMLGIRHLCNKNGAATLSYLSATAPFVLNVTEFLIFGKNSMKRPDKYLQNCKKKVNYGWCR